MRYIIIILSFFVVYNAHSQAGGITDTQIRVRNSQDPDSLLIMTNDTNDLSPYYKTGKWRKASDVIGTIAGDSDWWKLGGTTIPTNSDSAYRSGYTLFTGLDGGLPTKIEMLKEGIIRFDKTGLYNTPSYLFSVNPFQSGANVGRMGMLSYASDNTYGAKKNQVFAFGINPIDADDSATGLYFSFEDYYRPSAPSAYSELHLVFNDSSDVDRRLWTWFINKSDPTAYTVTYYTDQFNIRDPRALTSDSTYFKIEQVDGVQSQMLLLGANNSVSGGSKGIGQLVHTSNNTFEIYPYGSMPSSSEFYTRQFNVTNVNRLRIENDFGTTNGSSGEATTIIGREGSYGGVVGVDSGWGWDLIGGALVIDSSQVATQYDLTLISGGATDLTIGGSGPTYTIESSTGTDVTVANLYGLTLSESPANTLNLEVDTSKVATQYDITQIPISSLKAAAASNTISNANYAQAWQWNTLAGTSGLKLSSTSTAAASNAQKLFEIDLSGANASSGQSTYGAYVSNAHTGTTATNYALYGIATGAASANYGVYGTSNSGGLTGNVGAGLSGRNSNGGIAVEGITTTGGIGVYAESPDGYSLYSYTTNGTASAMRNNWSTNSTYGSVLDIVRSTSNGSHGAAGIGGGIAFYNETSTGATSNVSNQIKSIWTTATNASRVSDFIITGVNAAVEADLLTLKGSGKVVLNKYGVGSFTSGTPTYNIVVDASGNLMEAAVPVGGLNVIEENNVVVQSANVNIDFQNPFDVTTDGASEVNISFDSGEFTTVTTAQSDDYILMHDSGASANEKMLWSDFVIDLISFEEDNINEGTGNTIDLGTGLDGAYASAEYDITLDFNEFITDAAAEGDEYVIVYDPSSVMQEKILIPTFLADVNGLWSASNDNTNIANSTFEVGVPGYLDFRDGTEHDLYIDAANDRIGMGTNSPNYGLHVKNDAGAAIEASAAGVNEVLKIEGTADGGGINTAESSLLFNYTDADYSAGAEQQGIDMTLYKEADATQWTTFKITAKEATDADAVVVEKNADFTGNTTESHVAFNGGIAYTQNYDGSTAGANLSLDRSYYTVNITGGNLTDTIKLPEVASTADNWSSSLSSSQCQVGQEYVISNLRSGVNLVIGAYNPAGTSDDLIGTRTAPGGSAGSAISIAPGKSAIIKCYQLAGGIGYWNYWLSD